MRTTILTATLSLLLLTGIAHGAAPHPSAVQANHFAHSLERLSRHLADGREVSVEITLGGYGGITNDLEFYRAVTTRDRASGRVISRIMWESANPQNLHGAEVNLFDREGRPLREYRAMYLPDPNMRKAPYFTSLILHRYVGGLHATREFDASGWPLYEGCEGRFKGHAVSLYFEHIEAPASAAEIEDPHARAAYRACFEDFPDQPGPYLDPMVETR